MSAPFGSTPLCTRRGAAGIGAGPDARRGFSAAFAYGSAVEAVDPSESRLRALLEASTAIASDLSLDSLLQRLVTTAAELTGARYAALGVIDPSGQQLERFVTTGIDDETHRAIGELPRGRGILGALINEATPLRLHDLSDDPRSVGFPPNHPPMHTFLGVPILLRGVAYGNFYLTEKADGEDFTEDDQELVTLLAAQAAVAIENARLYEASTQWSTAARVAERDRQRAGDGDRPRAPPRSRRAAAARAARRPPRRGAASGRRRRAAVRGGRR